MSPPNQRREPPHPRLLLLLATVSRGGAEEYALTLSKHAIERGWDVHVGFPLNPETDSLRADFCAAGATFHNAAIGGAPDHPVKRALEFVRQVVRTLSLLRSVGPNVVELVLPWPDRGLGSTVAAALTRTPTLTVFQLMPTVVTVGPRRRGLLAWARRRRQQWIAISKHNRHCIARSFGLEEEEIGLVYNGVPENPDEPADRAAHRERVRRELGVEPDAIMALSVGRLEPQKGHRDAIRALAALPQSHRIKFVIAGDGALRDELTQLAADGGLEDDLLLLGHRSDIPDLLNAADLFLFPSHFEGLGIALLEAMSHGVPCIVSDTGPFPEIVESGREALMHGVGDVSALSSCISWAVTHRAEMQTLGLNGKARSLLFSETAMVDATLRYLTDLAARP